MEHSLGRHFFRVIFFPPLSAWCVILGKTGAQPVPVRKKNEKKNDTPLFSFQTHIEGEGGVNFIFMHGRSEGGEGGVY